MDQVSEPRPSSRLARLVGIGLLATLGATFGLNAVWVARHRAALSPVAGGAIAPTFRLPLAGGGEFALGAAPGRVTVIDFWASWCPPCRAEMPTLAGLSRRYRDHGVDVVAVNVENAEARPQVDAYLKSAHLEMPFALGGGDVAERYHVENLPHLVIVDGTGRVRNVMIGPVDERELAAAIDAAR